MKTKQTDKTGIRTPSENRGGRGASGRKFEVFREETNQSWTLVARTPEQTARFIEGTKKLFADAGLSVRLATGESKSPEVDYLNF